MLNDKDTLLQLSLLNVDDLLTEKDFVDGPNSY